MQLLRLLMRLLRLLSACILLSSIALRTTVVPANGFSLNTLVGGGGGSTATSPYSASGIARNSSTVLYLSQPRGIFQRRTNATGLPAVSSAFQGTGAIHPDAIIIADDGHAVLRAIVPSTGGLTPPICGSPEVFGTTVSFSEI